MLDKYANMIFILFEEYDRPICHGILATKKLFVNLNIIGGVVLVQFRLVEKVLNSDVTFDKL